MDKQSLTADIKNLALQKGFHKVGIARAGLLPRTGFLAEWLSQGKHGQMHWMANYLEKRMDIRKLVPGARSVIVVAHNYYTPYSHSNDNPIGKISRYAWGKDYHKVMKKKLKALLYAIQKLDEKIVGRIFVDSAPVQEKLWAQQAGIGWQGKNTNIISRGLGSWFFIGELVVNINLEADPQATDYCGSCRACIEACPTGALQEYQLDARRCLSYLTIEYHDEPIPEALAGKMCNWIFGCDICQDVCPWNRFAWETDEVQYYPSVENVQPLLDDLNRMTEQEFNRRFKRTPVMRAKYKNFKRNVAAVLKGIKER